MFGFWRPQGQEFADYELRFYPSHEAAVEHGTAPAAEVSGKDAVFTKADMTWTEGAKDRVVRDVQYGEGTWYARYGDFAIFGNVVMLCQGIDSMESLERCEALIDALGGE